MYTAVMVRSVTQPSMDPSFVNLNLARRSTTPDAEFPWGLNRTERSAGFPNL